MYIIPPVIKKWIWDAKIDKSEFSMYFCYWSNPLCNVNSKFLNSDTVKVVSLATLKFWPLTLFKTAWCILNLIFRQSQLEKQYENTKKDTFDIKKHTCIIISCSCTLYWARASEVARFFVAFLEQQKPKNIYIHLSFF